jgi:hypothetical protein
MTLNNATFSLNAFEKRAKSVQTLLKSVQTLFENYLKSVQKVGAAFRKLARRNTYGDCGDRLGVGCMGIIEGSVLDDYDCDIILYFIYILNFIGSVLRTNSRTIRYTLRAFDISTMNFIGLIHVSSFFQCFGCLSERAENTLSVASLLRLTFWSFSFSLEQK